MKWVILAGARLERLARARGLAAWFHRGFWAGKRVFVTGHTGFKGSWLVLWLGLTLVLNSKQLLEVWKPDGSAVIIYFADAELSAKVVDAKPITKRGTRQ